MQENYTNDDTIRYTYNNNGDVTAQYKNDNSRPYVTYTYNYDGDLTEKVSTDTKLKYVYGENDKIEVYKTSDNTLVQSYTEDVTKADEANNITAKTDVTEKHFGTTYLSVIKDKSVSYTIENNTVEYGYAENDNSISSDTVKYSNSNVLNSEYTYDSNGNKTVKDYGNSKSVINTYDIESRITSTSYNNKTYNYTYDANSQLTAVSGTNYSAFYAYDNKGSIL